MCCCKLVSAMIRVRQKQMANIKLGPSVSNDIRNTLKLSTTKCLRSFMHWGKTQLND